MKNTSPSRAPKTILLVEDEALIAHEEARRLRSVGYKVIHRRTGEEAVSILATDGDRIDLVLMDIDLGPGMDGTDAAREILRSREVPILFLSSHLEPDIVARTEEITNYGYVVKSSVFTVLDASIKMAFKLHDAHLAARVADERYQAFIRQSHEGIYRCELEGPIGLELAVDEKVDRLYASARVAECNPAFVEMHAARSPADLIGRSLRSFHDGPDFETCRVGVRAFAECGFNASESETVETKIDGARAIFHNHFVGIVEDGALLGFWGIKVDTSERKLMEKKLRDEERRFRALVENSQDAFSLIDERGTVTYESPSYGRVMGYDEKNRIGKNFMELIHPDDQHRLVELQASMLSGKAMHQIPPTRVRHADGSWRWIEGSASNQLAEPGIKAIVTNFRDITDRVEQEERLARSRQQYRDLLDAIAEGYCFIDERTTFLLANPAAERLFGVDSGKLVGRSLKEFVDASGRALLDEKVAERKAGKPGNYILPILRAGGERRILRIVASPMFDADGTYLGASSILSDITDQLQAEEALKELAEHRSVLMKELQHRVKNTLTIVASLIGIAEQGITDRKAIEALTETVVRIDCMSAVYERLYLSESLEEIDFAKYIDVQVSSFFEAYAVDPGRIGLEVQTQPVDLDTGRATSLGLILTELLTNAIKYAFPPPARGTIRIVLAREGEGVCLAVSDDGVGPADPKALEEAGTMGMLLIRELTRQLGGELSIDSRRGVSVSVRFNLP